MFLETYTPTALLQPFVKSYIVVDCSEAMLNSMLPDTSLIMGFRYKGTTRYITDETERALPFAVVAGLRKSIQLMKDAEHTANLLVIFHTAGASAFIKEPLHQLFGEIVSLDDCTGFKALGEIEERLCEAGSDIQRIQIVEEFLISRLYHAQTDALVSGAVQIINSHKGYIRVKDLAARLHISIDAFEKRFRRTVGATPKQLCNIVRMNSIVHNIHNNRLVETALEAGYYDQAHFSKDLVPINCSFRVIR